MIAGWLDRRSNAAGSGFRLSLPEPHAGCHPRALIRPTEFRAWLADLPTANPLVTSEKIAYQLGLLARYPEKINRLKTILALITTPVANLAEQVNWQLREKANETEMALVSPVLRAFSEANHEFAHLQKRAINEMLDDGKVPSAELFNQTLASLAHQIRLNLTAYASTSPGAWRDMLRLYALAGSLDLFNDEPVGGGLRTGSPEDPHDLLIGTLLYQLTDPLQLPTAQNMELFDHAVELARLGRLTLATDSAHLIAVDRSGSLTPMTAARGVETPAADDLGYLDVSDVVEELAAIPEPTPNDILLLNTLRNLSAEYSDLQGRRHPRIPRQAIYEMFVGITAIHQRLVHLTDDESPALAAEESIFSGAESPSVQRKHAGVICQQINFSEGGAAFELTAVRSMLGQVGDLVLFESRSGEDQQSPTGLLTRVRRLLRRNQSTLEIGVEKVNARVSPVRIKGHRGSGHALVDPGTSEVGWQLFAHADAARVGAVLDLESSQGALQVRVEKEVDRTPTMVHALVSRMR